jgi:phosphate starvation-inducible protein PhoH and related proteins
VQGLSFVYFDESDVVRHHLVQRIIRAYDEHKTKTEEQQLELLEAKVVGNGHATKPRTDNASAEIAE